jgi:PAS domain S-box-containing protein
VRATENEIMRRFIRIASLAAVPILAISIGLGVYAYRQAYDAALDKHREAMAERVRGVEQIVVAMHDHVAELQLRLGTTLADAHELSPSSTVASLDPADYRDPENGMALAPPESDKSETFRRDLAAAELLLPGMRAARDIRSHLQWNYIFDGQKRFVVTGPWIPAEDFWQSADWRREFAGLFEYDIFTMAMPDKNPAGEAFWTPAYLDAFGAGLMVSHGAPVTVSGKFAAIVGADVLLVFLSKFLDGFPEVEGEFLIADQAGNAIANERGLSAEQLVSTESMLGSGFAAAATAPAFASADGMLVSVSPIAGTPWRLFHAVERGSIVREALASALPFGLVAAALLLTLGGLYAALASNFVRPAMQLVEFLATPQAGHAGLDARLPAHWRGAARRIFDLHDEAAQLLQNLERSKAESAAVIDAALDAVVIADGEGRITGFNPAAERMFGYAAREAVGKLISETIVPPVHRAMHEAGMRRYQETGQASVLGRRIELEGIRANGEMFPIEISIHSVDLPGQTSFAAYLRDLSAIRDADRKIAEQREKIHQSEKLSAMGSLLAGVAHELNNPLAVVVAHASLLETKSRGSVKLRAQKIHSAAERCARIVKSFLAMVRQKPAMREVIDLNRLVDGAVEMLGYGLKSAGADVVRELEEGLPAIEADKDLFNQVVVNLVVNAQQALTDRPQPRTIWVRTRSTSAAVMLEVADNGPGVPAEVVPRIFDAYFTTKPVGVGTGIGLAICRDVVTAHGGELDYSDRPGGGAVFRLVMPAATGGLDAARLKARPGNTRLSLLIVDDDAEVAEALHDILVSAGHKAKIAATGEVGLRLVDQGAKFDAVFADLRMPDMNGAAFRNALAAKHPQLARRTVIVTGDVVAGPIAVKAASGEDGLWMEKPFMRDDVAAMLERLAVLSRADR